MKILWVGDAIAATGFARCTHTACDALHAAGHSVHVLGINYWGDPHPYPYDIYPCYQPLDQARDPFGTDRLSRLARRLSPDLIILLNDPWNVPAYLDALDAADISTPVVAWLAVDGRNQYGTPLNRLHHVITWTRFAVDELRLGGYEGPASVVPLGVDLDLFTPQDRAESRLLACPPEFKDGFIVGVVGRNQPRKRLDLTLAYFAEWISRYSVPDAYLYLHVAPTGDRGFNLHRLAHYHNLQGRVMLAEPHIGFGIPSDELPYVYSAFDVCLTTTQGEGWGLCTLEAMACGVPCIVPSWSALAEWPEDAALAVPCTSTAVSAPVNGNPYTIGGIPDRDATVRALQRLYTSARVRKSLRQRGRALARLYPWTRTAREFVSVVESLARQTDTPYTLDTAQTLDPQAPPTPQTDTDPAYDPAGYELGEACA